MLGPVRSLRLPHPGGKPLLAELQLHRPGRRPLTIGDHCNFGPNVTIDAHAPYAARRAPGMVCDDGVEQFLCYAKPVTIGHDCWFGANVVVCPGVTIGENCVIGAGSVVTRDILRAPSPPAIRLGSSARLRRRIPSAAASRHPGVKRRPDQRVQALRLFGLKISRNRV